MSDLRVVTAPSAAAAAEAAAGYIAERAGAAMAARGRFLLALSGGSTPRAMLAALGRLAVDWRRVQVFQVDERIAPAGDAARNLNMLTGSLIDTGLLTASQLHPMPVESTDADAIAAAYAATLESIAGNPPTLDLVHLGLGDDGHTASLVPGDAVLDCVDRDVAVTGPYRGHRRVTLTYPAIERARERLWLATGADKAPMLARLMRADVAIPAARIDRRASVVFTDVTLSPG